MMRKFPGFVFAPILVLLSSTFALAQASKDELKIYDAWARATVPGQSVSGAYMHIKSGAALKLVKAESPVAALVEIHNMSMKDGVMSMSAVNAVDIPAGQIVDLKPGGYHIMLMQLKGPIKADDAVPLTLTFEDAKKKRHSVTVSAKAQARD